MDDAFCWSGLTRLEELERMLAMLQTTFEAKHATDAQGATAAVRAIFKLHPMIDAERKRTERDVGGLTEEELTHEHRKAARGMPDAHLEVYVEEYARRYNVPKLRLVGKNE